MSTKEFENFYKSELSNILDEVERERKAFILCLLNRIIITAIFSLVLLMIYNENFNLELQFLIPSHILFILFIIGILFYFYGCYSKYKDYHKSYKTKVIGNIIKFIDDSLTYKPYDFIPKKKFVESNIFNTRIDRYTGSDYISGKVGYTAIEFSQIHAQYKTETTYTDSNGRTHKSEQWHTIFQGIFFIADFNKDFRTRVILWPDESGDLMKSIKKKFASLRGWKNIELENPEFGKYFIAYGEDHIEARYILSTSLIERIVEFRKRMNKKNYISFANSKIFVGIPYGTLFKPVILSSVKNYKKIEEYFICLNLVYNIVQDFNLNKRIWSKLPQL